MWWFLKSWIYYDSRVYRLMRITWDHSRMHVEEYQSTKLVLVSRSVIAMRF